LSILSNDIVALRESGDFDENWYRNEYPDVDISGLDPAYHYLWIGRRLGRRPNSAGALMMSKMSLDASEQLQHFEAMASCTGLELAKEASHLQMTERRRSSSAGEPNCVYQFIATHFDNDFYLTNYPDILAAGVDPVRHYLDKGWQENRDPSPSFSTRRYLMANPDVLASGMNPYFHWLRFGKAEGRYTYDDWLIEHDTISPVDIAAMKMATISWTQRPTFSVIMPVYNTPEQLLREALDSVIAQAYPHWEMCIADDCSPSPDVRRVLDEYAARDSRIKIIYRENNGHISEASNTALSIATGEWYALMDHDDLLPPHALYCMAHAIVHNPDVRLLYSDEDKINQAGQREGAYFKSDFNLELFRSQNMISHFGVYHRGLIDQVGGFRSEFNGSQDYDLALRCIEVLRSNQIHHIPRVLYHWRIVEGSTALSNEEKPYAMIAGERAINEHYRRLGINATAELINYGYRTRYHLKDMPLVSIIIPTRDAKDLVRQCIDSLVVKTTYDNYEVVLVDNGSDDPTALAYFDALAANSRIKVICDKRPFNYSALNNNAVKHCRGDILVLLNNDTEVISHDWLETMVGHVMQPDVGAVGAKLLYPDDTVQHAGVVLGLGGAAGHVHLGLNRHEPGFFGRLGLANEYSAVSAACLAVRKDYFLAVGGLNETELSVAFSDIDFCLRLRKHGLRNVYTPFAELYHHESATRGSDTTIPNNRARFEEEQLYMNRYWSDVIAVDPGYSPNLSLEVSNFGLASKPRISKIW
jgi:glycosyltransferase involved in cell wall biosynthesis